MITSDDVRTIDNIQVLFPSHFHFYSKNILHTPKGIFQNLIVVDMEWFVPSEDTDESSQRKDNRVIDADFHIISEGPTEGIKDRHHKKYQKK